MKNSFIEVIKVLGLSSVLLAGIALSSDLMFTNHELYFGNWMHFGYIKTVESFPHINPVAPYCWRLLVPLLVSILPFSIEIGFFIITYTSIIASSLLIYLIIKHLFNDIYYPWIGVLTYFSLINVVRINAIEFIAVDSLAFMFMLLSVFSIYKRHNTLFIISTLLGLFTKEIIFIVCPLYFTINYISGQNKKYYYNLIFKTFIFSLPAVAAYVILKLVIIPEGNSNYFELLVSTAKYRVESLSGSFSTFNKSLFAHQNTFENSLINIYRISFGAIGPVLYFIILKSYRIRNVLFRLSPIIILSFFQIFIARDNERLVAVGFPAYVLLYLYVIQSFVKEKGIDIKIFFIYSIINVISQLFLTKNFYYQIYYSVLLQLILGLVMLVIIYCPKSILPRSPAPH